MWVPESPQKFFVAIFVTFLLTKKIMLKQKERISNYCLVRELFWPLRFRFYILNQWRWFMPFSSDDFPGQYKRLCNALSTSLLIHSCSRTDNINMKRVYLTMGHCSFRRLLLYHLFLPPRSTGPQNFRLNA